MRTRWERFGPLLVGAMGVAFVLPHDAGLKAIALLVPIVVLARRSSFFTKRDVDPVAG